ERPLTSSRRATSCRCFLLAFASTPPAVGLSELRLPVAACSSDGPFFFLGSQWSPTFSNSCLSAENAVRCARSPSPYSSTAESCAFDQMDCACFGERLMVSGISFDAGMVVLLSSSRYDDAEIGGRGL